MDKKIEVFPGWEIVEKIGEGGFSTVYKIRKTDSGEFGKYYAAMKVVSVPRSALELRSLASEGYDKATIDSIITSQVNKIVEEFRIMARFKGNSNIVSHEDHKVIPHNNDSGSDILIRMELLEPLTDYYNHNPLDEKETVKLGIDICRALELCGKEDVIHRDVKPQNIFINKYGDYKLGDFGVARLLDHTTHATSIGTFTYIAPEVYKGDEYGFNADIYSLGLVLYWLLNERRLPFMPLLPAVPTSSDIRNAALKRLSGEPLPQPKNGSENLKKIVLKACAFNRNDRYQTPIQFRIELEREFHALNTSDTSLKTVKRGETVTVTETAKQGTGVTVTETAKKDAVVNANLSVNAGSTINENSTTVATTSNNTTLISLGKGDLAKQPDFSGDKTTPIASPSELGSDTSETNVTDHSEKNNGELQTNKPSKNSEDEFSGTDILLVVLAAFVIVGVIVGVVLGIGSLVHNEENIGDQSSTYFESVAESDESEAVSNDESEAVSDDESEAVSNDGSEAVSNDEKE